MTGLLKDLLHDRADSLDAPQLHVAEMIRDGERRLARRRQAIVGGLVAASFVMAAGVALAVLRPGEDPETRIAGEVPSYDVAYALGGTIHDGRRTVDTGIRIAALVQGISGYVVADEQRRIHTVVDGQTRQVGRLAEVDHGRIVSDGDVVAWVDSADGGTLSVLDLATGDRVDVPVDAWPGEAQHSGSIDSPGAHIAAVDGRTVYVADARGVMVWEALEGDDPVLLPAPAGATVSVRDVQDGQILHVVPTFEPQERNGATTMVQVDDLRVGTDLEDGRSVPGTGGRLSPDGQYLAFLDRQSSKDIPSHDTTTVGEVSGDSWTPVTPDGHDSVAVYGWLDADTFVASAWTWEPMSRDLLSCEASTFTCTTVLPGFGDQMVLPTGYMEP